VSRPFVILTSLNENISISGSVTYSDALGANRTTGFVRSYRPVVGGLPRPPHRFVPPEKPDPDYKYED
jgi:hypothetical protein